MDQILKGSKIAALLALTAFLLVLAHSSFTLPLLVQSELALTRNLIDVHADAITKTTDKQLSDWRSTTDTQLRDIRNMADRRIGSLENLANTRIVDIQGQAFRRLDRIIGITDRSALAVTGSTTKLIDGYAALPARLEHSLKPYTDCGANDFCWQNLATDSMVAFRASSRDTSATMQSISGTIPEIAGDIRKSTTAFATQFPVIAQNTSNITANIDRLTKPKWYDRAFGYAANGSLIWFNINRSKIPTVTVTK